MLALLWPAMLAAAAAPRVTPAEVSAMLDSVGSARTVERLGGLGDERAPTRFDAVLDGIASGDPAWLALLPRLSQGADGGNGEALAISVTHVVAHNAAAALRLIADGAYTAEDICADGDIEPARADYEAYYRAAIPAVTAVSDPALAGSRAACLARLRATEAYPG